MSFPLSEERDALLVFALEASLNFLVADMSFLGSFRSVKIQLRNFFVLRPCL